MAKAILICGKIASGKSWYCRGLLEKSPALLLSVDEITGRIFGNSLGEAHDLVCEKIQAYLLDKAVEAVRAGADVILDWGFWTQKDRRTSAEFFRRRRVPVEWHYISVADAVWRENIALRNAAVLAGEDPSYYVDEGLLQKLQGLFEPPEPEEMDVIIEAALSGN